MYLEGLVPAASTVAAAVEPSTATTMETAATAVESAPAEAAASRIALEAVREVSARVPTAAVSAASESAALVIVSAAAVKTASAISVAPAVSESSAVEAASVPMKPRASPDKDATDKPVRTVIPIRSASIWVVVVIPVGAHRRRSVVSRSAKADPERYPLGIRVRSGNQPNSQANAK